MGQTRSTEPSGASSPSLPRPAPRARMDRWSISTHVTQHRSPSAWSRGVRPAEGASCTTARCADGPKAMAHFTTRRTSHVVPRASADEPVSLLLRTGPRIHRCPARARMGRWNAPWPTTHTMSKPRFARMSRTFFHSSRICRTSPRARMDRRHRTEWFCSLAGPRVRGWTDARLWRLSGLEVVPACCADEPAERWAPGTNNAVVRRSRASADGPT